MTNALEHRGPDDYGFAAIEHGAQYAWKEQKPSHIFNGPTVGLGHRRLSILDTSEAGRQPMSTANGRYWIAYNGEVYNYTEIRSELQKLGFEFYTGTDTEVVLKAFEAWGTECFSRFNGMWALVIVDSQTGEVTASRDRFGVKPLYYWNEGDEWIFASEVKALVRNPTISTSPNQDHLHRFICSLPNPDINETFFAGIYSLKPATVMTIRNGRASETNYWQIPETDFEASMRTDESYSDQLRWLLDDSVRLRLRSDVRVGTMVSGGIDSTSVISTIRSRLIADPDARNVVGDMLHGFHAHFPGHPIDEQRNVEALAQAHNLNIHVVEPMQLDDVAERYTNVVGSMERPFVRSVPLVNTLLMECAKKNGITVVLNGHGADELFAGYPDPYVILAGADLLKQGNVLGASLNALGCSQSGMSSRLVFAAMLKTAFPKIFTGLSRPRTRDFTRGGILRNPPSSISEGQSNCIRSQGHLGSRLRSDFTQNILPDWLHMEDRASMSASVEARQPFLDYRLVEFAFHLGGQMKIRKGMTKYVVRQAMKQYLPQAVVNDRRKQGFSGPDAIWLRGAMSSLIDDFLMSGSPRVAPFVNLTSLREHICAFRKQTSNPVGPVLWRILETEIWLRRFFG